MKPIKVVAKNHQEWLSLRSGIGSSDIATIMGESKYDTPYRLWRRLRGEERVEANNNLLRMGHMLEPVVAKLWEEETGNKIFPWSEAEYMYVHPQYDFLRASPDREFAMQDGRNGILECKSSQIPIDADEIPGYWLCQIQYQMGIAQIDYCNIAWLIQGRDFGFSEVIFNKDVFDYMVECAKKFWIDNVIGGAEPELDEDKGDVQLKYRHSSNRVVECDSELLKLYSEVKELKEKQRGFEKEIELKVNRIKARMQDADTLAYNGQLLVTWKSGKDKCVFDEMWFRKENHELYDKYTIQKSGSRIFLVK